MTNDFVPFATAGGANVEPQSTYLADSNRTNGQQPGVASSALNNKALRQANFITSQFAQFILKTLNNDVLDNGVSAQVFSQIQAALTYLPPIGGSIFASGAGTYYLPFVFFIASGNATAAATYTNNGHTYTVSTTVSAGTVLTCIGTGFPLVSGTLTKSGGTGDATLTFYAFRSPLYLDLEMVGGGGGGNGTTRGTDGGDTTFDGSTFSAGGGKAEPGADVGGGLGGTAVAGGGIVLRAYDGQQGGFSDGVAGIAGSGGNSFFSGATQGNGAVPDVGGAVNGSGSGGAGLGNQAASGGGGGAGAYIRAWIMNPNATYAYVVGAGGAKGSQASDGAAGSINVLAYFQ